MKSFKLLIIVFLSPLLLLAQTAPPSGLVDIKQDLKKLNVLGSVLYVAAHPDDENTKLLSYLSQEKHYRTGYLSLTRGDGGQNLLGNEQGEQLGLIRTQELLAARRIDGAEQFFTRANDFGFSKGPAETLKFWDKDKVLGDVVWVIRKFRPDVIICRFPTTGEGGHGNHTASAILAQEAFTAAADPRRYPEQLQYVQPWQAKRLLWNTFNFGGLNTTAPDQFKIDIGGYNPLLGKGYGEIAAESRSNHKSQGMGAALQRGESFESFKIILGEAPKTDLFDDVNTTWARVRGGTTIDASLAIIQKSFDDNYPERSVPALVQLLNHIEKISDTYWKAQKTKDLKNLIAACAGLWFEAYATAPTYAVGDSIKVNSQILNRYNNKVKLNAVKTPVCVHNLNQVIPANQLQVLNDNLLAAHITQPYWLETEHTQGNYVVSNQQDVGNPENSNLPTVSYEFVIEGKPIEFARRVMYKHVDPVHGEVYQPIEITPPVTANIDNQVYVFKDAQPQTVVIKMKSFVKGGGSITLNAQGWRVTPAVIDFADKKKGEEWNESFTVTPAGPQTRSDRVKAVVTVKGKTYDLGLKRIRYEHIPAITLFPPAVTNFVKIDLHITGKNIGYITGAGDLIPDALRQLGYQVTILNENDIMKGDLSAYDAIVTGIRAYNVNDRLVVEQPKLMQYVKNGGNLIVQYNNNNGLVVDNIGPYPFKVVNKRVTEEDAKVTITDPTNPVLNYPNKINGSDFDGWVQERGLYFVTDADPKYQTPLQMNDATEAPNNGSLLVTEYGKGRFVYTSLAFFRQLPAGVPGAYRLFINLLSNPANNKL
jgi:LmbE family N-acetylglucosaminyl deacetylase